MAACSADDGFRFGFVVVDDLSRCLRLACQGSFVALGEYSRCFELWLADVVKGPSVDFDVLERFAV